MRCAESTRGTAAWAGTRPPRPDACRSPVSRNARAPQACPGPVPGNSAEKNRRLVAPRRAPRTMRKRAEPVTGDCAFFSPCANDRDSIARALLDAQSKEVRLRVPLQHAQSHKPDRRRVKARERARRTSGSPRASRAHAPADGTLWAVSGNRRFFSPDGGAWGIVSTSLWKRFQPFAASSSPSSARLGWKRFQTAGGNSVPEDEVHTWTFATSRRTRATGWGRSRA